VSYESFSPFLACPFLRLHLLAPVLSHQIKKPALWLLSIGLLLADIFSEFASFISLIIKGLVELMTHATD